jgi:glycosyltransferase involved in cell wall biosynthesis
MVIQSFLPVLGGAQRQVDLLAPLLQSRGVELTAITRHPPGTPRREQRRGLAVRRMPGPDRGGAGSIAYTAGGALALARLRPDVVHVHDLLSPSTIALLSRPLVRAPVIAKVLSTGPGGDLDRLLTKPFGRARLRAMARSFSAFLCLSQEVVSELAAHGIGSSRLRRIPNGVDVHRFRPAADENERRGERDRLGLGDSDGPLALYCGRFEAVKRLDLLVEAVAQVPDLRLALVGEGREEAHLHALLTRLGLERRVTLLPTVEDPAPLYRSADLYLSASSTEGMSNSVLEAMASGLPVLATAASGMDELVLPTTGVLVEGRPDAGRFAAALAGLAEDAEERLRLGGGGRALVAERYSLDSVADRLHDLYREVLAESRAGTDGRS